LIGLYLAAFILLVVVKILYPTGGPTFAHLTLDHLLANFQASLSINFGHGFYDLVFDKLLPHSGEFERRIALTAGIVTFAAGAVGAALAGLSASSSLVPGFRPALRLAGLGLAIMVAGAVFFLAAYLPAYVWYISPRHDYLPSVGVAVLAAGAVSIAVSLCARLHKALGGIMAALVLAALGGFLYFTVQTILIEKNQWIVSYQARKNLYAALAHDAKFRAASTLVLDGFPAMMPLSSAPLGYQQPSEVALMTGGAVRMIHLVQNATPAEHGEFIYTEGDQWGMNAFLYIPEANIYHAYFQRLDGDRIDYSSKAPALPTPPFSIGAPDQDGAQIANASLSGPVPTPRRQIIYVAIPSIEVGPGRALALRPLIEDHGVLAPLMTPNAQGAACEVLIDVSRFAEGASPAAVRIAFDASALPRIAGFELWLVDQTSRRMVRRKIVDQ
jgi:hypothetical protein